MAAKAAGLAGHVDMTLLTQMLHALAQHCCSGAANVASLSCSH